MLVSIKSQEVHDWDSNQKVYVYTANKKCVKLCRVIDLNLRSGDALRARKLRTLFVEPVDENLQLCHPKERELPPNCVGGRH